MYREGRIGKDESGRTNRERRIGQDELGRTNRAGTNRHVTTVGGAI